jgi:uncharacterized C2H2 Zn-finger protein
MTADDSVASLPCRICGRSFTTSGGLRIHVSRMHGVQKSLRYAKSKENVLIGHPIHAANVSVSEELVTVLEDAGKSDTLTLSAPSTADISVVSLCCRYCGRSFKTDRNLRIHVSKMHGDQQSVMSAIPTESVRDLDAVSETAVGQTEHEENVSTSITQVTRAEDAGELHTLTVSTPSTTDISVVSLRCRYCGRSFKTDRSLRTHVSKMHGDQQSVMSAMSTESVRDLDVVSETAVGQTEHEENVSTSITQVTKKGAEDAGELHTLTVSAPSTTDISVASLRCRYCGRSFKTDQGLRTHASKMHGDQQSVMSATSMDNISDLESSQLEAIEQSRSGENTLMPQTGISESADATRMLNATVMGSVLTVVMLILSSLCIQFLVDRWKHLEVCIVSFGNNL